MASLSERCWNYHQVIQQEVEIWRELDHEHILKFIGACPVAEKPFMVCEMKANGDVLTFLRKNPNASKRKIVSIIYPTWFIASLTHYPTAVRGITRSAVSSREVGSSQRHQSCTSVLICVVVEILIGLRYPE